jgi:hypothetical protein
MNIIQTKKIIPYLLTLIILVGLFNPIIQAHAQDTTAPPSQQTITVTSGTPPPQEMQLDTTPTAASTQLNTQLLPTTPLSTLPVTGTTPAATPATTTTTTTSNSAFQDIINGNFVCSNLNNFTVSGCLGQLGYWILMVVPAYILWVAAYFFNVFAYVTLSGKLFSNAGFISTAWGVTRDLSNIFFILILLYIAIKLILGIDAHGTKKMIARVVIIALLINFSMFFTYVIIDSSNILALIFYNKINVGTIGPDGKTPILAPYESATGEKDVAGGLTGAFNPANKLDSTFFASASNINHIPNASNNITGSVVNAAPTTNGSTPVSAEILFGIMILSGTVMLVASYAFFVSGFSFLGRMIELFVLIIFSPFAFMSFTIPQLASVEYIGWNAWFKRLLSVSFMAAIFMFFMYFIFLLVGANLFGGLITKASPPSFVENVLGIFLPAMLIVVLLLQATEYAKKGSGKFGEMVMKGAQIVGGIAMGAATGGTAMLASNTVGRLARNAANNDELRAKAAAGDKGAQRKLAIANSLAKNSFDFRQTGIGKFAAKQTGMNVDRNFGIKALSTEQLKGGRAGRDKEAVEKHEEKKKTYLLTKDAELKQNTRNEQYEKDKADAKTNSSNNDNKELGNWEKQYEADKEKAKRVAERAGGRFNEDKFKSDYENGSYISGGKKITAPPKPTTKEFNEKAFKEAYEKGGDLKNVGLNKTVAAGNVRDARGVNDDRKRAYALSLEHPTFKIDTHGEIMKDELGKEIRKEFKDYMSSGMGSRGGKVIGTLGYGILGGGFASAIKDMAKDRMAASDNFVLKGVFGENKEIVATVRKGIDKKAQVLKQLSEIMNDDNKGHGGDKKEEGHKETANTSNHKEEPPAPNDGGNMHAPPLNH